MSDETHLHAYLRASDDESAVGDWSDVLNRSRRQRRRAATRAILWAAVALAALVIAVPAFGLGGIFPGILSGSAAPPQNDTALRALFPPYQIGHATKLAEYEGRSLFGAHTAAGGYCFSATSPVDPHGEGGHCVSSAEAQALDSGKTVAFAMSGWNVGGYAPEANSVHVSGAGLDLTFPVDGNGWWLGVAEVPHLPQQAHEGLVIATGRAENGSSIGSDPLMLVRVYRDSAGRVMGVGIASI
jgi:hypothetical protein